MKYFPMFMEVQGKLVLVCGGGRHAFEKIQRLKPFGVMIRVISSHISPLLDSVENITVLKRSFSERDLTEDPVFVIAAEDPDENKRIVSVCRTRHIPVNAVDQPEDCDFIFPSLFATDRLCIAVSTGGASPTTAMALRDRFVQEVPDRIDDILFWLISIREHLRSTVNSTDTQRRILRRLVQEVLALGRPLTSAESEAILSQIEN